MLVGASLSAQRLPNPESYDVLMAAFTRGFRWSRSQSKHVHGSGCAVHGSAFLWLFFGPMAATGHRELVRVEVIPKVLAVQDRDHACHLVPLHPDALGRLLGFVLRTPRKLCSPFGPESTLADSCLE